MKQFWLNRSLYRKISKNLGLTALLMTSCIAYEPAQLIPAITLSTEEVSFVEANHTDLVVDFGMETSANESDSLLNLEVLPGVRVRSVALNGPADSAGIQAGDVILFINNLPTNEPDAVLAIQTQTQLESYIFQIQRNTAVFEVTLYGRTITAAQEARELYRLDPIATRASYRTELATIRQQEQVAAARIIEIFPNSPLGAAGLKANDRILAVDGEFINSAQDFISKVNQEFELGDTLEITAHVDGKIEKRSLKLWSPRRRISRISMRPFFHFDSSISPPSKNFSVLDLWLFAVYSYSKIENENSHDILGIFNITSDYGELTEVQD